jgi:diguanylate cyclase (GGDEF)-like protein
MSAAAASASARPELNARSWAVWGAVLAGGAAAIALSVNSLRMSPPGASTAYGALVLLLLAWLAFTRPFPVGIKDGNASLDVVFVVCAAVMYGAAVAALISAIVCAFGCARGRLHPVKVVFNAAAFGLTGGAAGIAAHVGSGRGAGLIAAVALAAAAAWATSVALHSLMITRARFRDFVEYAWLGIRGTALPFTLSLSVVPLFIVSWRVHPYVAVLAVVPLAAVALHMHSLEKSRQATTLSLTDPLTGLGNRRQLSERLARELDRADAASEPLSVCVLDVDGFKAVNDEHGHEAGDQALVAIADVLRQGGEAFRLGGDEFVLLLPNNDAAQATEASGAVARRVRELGLAVSAGTATYTHDGAGRADLLRAADEQLYAARATRR